jgi:hypothetical protein
MPKSKVSDLITDQEMAFARLVLSGTMNDRAAAQTVGLNPDTAAYTKSKPRVRAYMLEHRAAVQQQLLDQESERLRRRELRREQVLDRLWEIAKMAPELTRNSITGQVKAISMIVAMEGLIPDRRTVSAQNKSALPPVPPPIDTAACPPRPAVGLREQQGKTTDPPPGTAADAPSDLDPIAGLPFDSNEPISTAHPVSPLKMTSSSTHACVLASAADEPATSPIDKPFTWRLRL